MKLRTFKCQLGEYLNSTSGGCVECDISQNQFSVTFDALKCEFRDEVKMKNLQPAMIELREGFWRAYYYSNSIEECYHLKLNCQGGWYPGDKSCALGHIGALCEQCDLYNTKGQGSFSISQQYICSNCEDMAANIANIVFVLIWTLLSVFLSVNSTIKLIEEFIFYTKLKTFGKHIIFQSSQTSVLLKVFTNYLQIIIEDQMFSSKFIFNISKIHIKLNIQIQNNEKLLFNLQFNFYFLTNNSCWNTINFQICRKSHRIYVFFIGLLFSIDDNHSNIIFQNFVGVFNGRILYINFYWFAFINKLVFIFKLQFCYFLIRKNQVSLSYRNLTIFIYNNNFYLHLYIFIVKVTQIHIKNNMIQQYLRILSVGQWLYYLIEIFLINNGQLEMLHINIIHRNIINGYFLQLYHHLQQQVFYCLCSFGLLFITIERTQIQAKQEKFGETYYWETIKILQKEFIIYVLIYYEDYVAVISEESYFLIKNMKFILNKLILRTFNIQKVYFQNQKFKVKKNYYKSSMIFFVLLFYGYLTNKYKPYETGDLNNIDSLQTAICKVSIILAQTIYTSQSLNIEEIVIPCYFLLAILNIFFIVRVITKILFAYFNKLSEQVDKVKRYISFKFPYIVKNNKYCMRLFRSSQDRKQLIRKRFQLIKAYLKQQARYIIQYKQLNNMDLGMNKNQKDSDNIFSEPFSSSRNVSKLFKTKMNLQTARLSRFQLIIKNPEL